MKELTRRQLGGVLGGVAAFAAIPVVPAQAQTPVPDNTAQDWDKAAVASHKENSEALAKFEVPMSTEPAFQFKA
jgi:hypothetical protein